MKYNEVLGAVVAGSLMVIAYGMVTQDHTEHAVRHTHITYTEVQPMPVERVVEIDRQQLHCMALNMYFEARNQDTENAMAAVGYTVLNRVAASRYPDTICSVVFQGQQDSRGNYIRNRCQFSWVCDGKPDEPRLNNVIEAEAWERANRVAMLVLTGDIDNPVGNATMYHATYVRPHWARAYEMVAKVEDHIFYEKVSTNG